MDPQPIQASNGTNSAQTFVYNSIRLTGFKLTAQWGIFFVRNTGSSYTKVVCWFSVRTSPFTAMQPI